MRVLSWLFLLFLLVSPRKASGSTLPNRSGTNPVTGKPISSWSAPALSYDELVALATRHGFADPVKAARIAQRESGGHPDAVVDTRGMTSAQLQGYWGKAASREYSVGLWQVNVYQGEGRELLYDPESLKDPEANAKAAGELFKRYGWKPWGG